MAGYKFVDDPVALEQMGRSEPVIVEDDTGTTSWRDAKKALRQWYLDQAKALRTVSEKDMFPK